MDSAARSRTVLGRAGRRLLLLDLDPAAVEALGSELAGSGVESLALSCDVTDEAACSDAVRRLQERIMARQLRGEMA